MFGYVPRLLAIHVLWLWCLTNVPVSAAEFYAVVEREGIVALCLSKGALLFADRCEGSGRLSIVQPIKEGTVVWRSAIGTVSLENDTPNAGCALSHAKWDPKSEEVVSTGRKIAKIDRSALLERMKQNLLKDADAVENDIAAFALDLDGDGKEEIVFAASNLNRLAEHYSGDEPVPYFVYAGVLAKDSTFPMLFFHDRGDYLGGTDAIGDVTIKGVVPIAPGSGELALLIKGGSGLSGDQTLIRYWHGGIQRIDTFEFICN
ncbi:hypothetical protein [Microvirga puerhi]|uniref:VCBS repeat-containing protein n=1 Tax=Microvirga puerhi TaxID=2876078 RepID=A0ABS7VLF5_9HYPH|nr:hypothetical protein [Microvirga puerhi]MBZ6076353.1 hypothetical protein [Microvirga puerhi]